MTRIYQRNFVVRWSELDANGRFGLEHYLRYLIETAYDWGESLDLGYQAYIRLGIYWLIRETELLVERFPNHNDEIGLKIWMNQWQRVRGIRSFQITGKGGELFAQGSQKIVVMDSKTQRPTKLEDDLIGRFRIDKPENVPSKDLLRNSASPMELYRSEREVTWSDLDAQKHVNNVVYINYARDLINDYLVRNDPHIINNPCQYIHIEYHSPAVWREKLIFTLKDNGQDESQKFYRVRAQRADGSAVMECVLGINI